MCDQQSPCDEELLYDSINANNLAKIEELVTKGVEINAYVRCGRTLLGRAVQVGNLESIKMLINSHSYWKPRESDQKNINKRRICDVNLLDYYERTALHYAAEVGSADIIRILLEAGSRANVSDSENVTPLYLAACKGNFDAVQELLNAGCQVDRRLVTDKTTPLHVAASRGYTSVVGALLEHGAKVDAMDQSDQTPLILAVNRANHEVVKLLLKKGAKPNIEEIHGYTPLAEAVWNKDEVLVEMLLEVGAKVTRSHFLLHYCVVHRNARLVHLLLKSGCLVNIRDDNGDTPLHIAARTGEVAIIELLLRYGANPNYPNMITGSVALHEAVENVRDCDHVKFTEILEVLLKYKSSLNFESNTPGDVPLLRSLLLKKYAIAGLLIRYGCDVKRGFIVACNIDNLQLAVRHNHFDTARLLVYGGFNLTNTYAWLVDEKYLRPAAHFVARARLGPLTLTNYCRLAVRRQFNDSVHEAISNMSLPSRIKRFLLFEDID